MNSYELQKGEEKYKFAIRGNRDTPSIKTRPMVGLTLNNDEDANKIFKSFG